MRYAIPFFAAFLITVSIHAATVRGIVRDDGGDALPGVTVYEKGSNDTVVTDGAGRFTIEVASLPATLVADHRGETGGGAGTGQGPKAGRREPGAADPRPRAAAGSHPRAASRSDGAGGH
ncbi:MAG: hypothetical protein ACXW29_00755 [Thermoanaerobaculia bacterium]